MNISIKKGFVFIWNLPPRGKDTSLSGLAKETPGWSIFHIKVTTQQLLALWNIKEDILSILWKSMELLLGSQCSSEYLLLCSVEVRNAYRVGIT